MYKASIPACKRFNELKQRIGQKKALKQVCEYWDYEQADFLKYYADFLVYQAQKEKKEELKKANEKPKKRRMIRINYSVKIGVFALFALILTGCSQFTPQQEATRKKGIINAVYTVLEYAPADKDQRINEYLDLNIKNKQLKTQEKQIIILCIERTEKSRRWQK